MPKRKKLPKNLSYEGMGTNSENAEIQKARPLQSLSETELTLPEFKILDAYLARINSHDKSKRTVILEKGELEKALGVTRILKDDLNKRLRHLFQVIEVKDDRKRKGFKLINLFEEADAEPDDNGLWQITLTCTASAREYIFNIDNIGYLRYRLKNVINLTSRYSYILFLYLIDNRFRLSWSIDIKDLKALLNCNADTYKQYKYFNDLVLKKCHKEICEKTDVCFSYKPIKKGRSVSAVEFTIEKNQAPKISAANDMIEVIPNSVETKEKDLAEIYESENLVAVAECCGDEFTSEQLQEIYDLASERVGSSDINKIVKHISQCIEKMNAQANPISNRFNYLCATIKKNKPKASVKSNDGKQSIRISTSDASDASFDLNSFKTNSFKTNFDLNGYDEYIQEQKEKNKVD